MRGAYAARTLHVRVMPYSNYDPACVAIRDSKNLVEQICFAVLDIAPQGEAAQIGDLYHAGERTVDKQRSFDDVSDFRPERSALVEPLHQQGVLVCRRLVVVVDQKPVILLSAVPVPGILQIKLEPGNQLLECLFVDRQRRPCADVVNLVDALCEQPDVIPRGHAIGDGAQKIQALSVREVDVGVRVPVIFLRLAVLLGITGTLKPEKLLLAELIDSRSPFVIRQRVEILNCALLPIGPCKPGGMNLLARHAKAAFYRDDLPVAFLPAPDRHGDSGKHEMGGVPWEIGGTGLVDVTQMHLRSPRRRCQKKSDWG